eukprot:353688-Chlamydomonas_euryale.AAC.1
MSPRLCPLSNMPCGAPILYIPAPTHASPAGRCTLAPALHAVIFVAQRAGPTGRMRWGRAHTWGKCKGHGGCLRARRRRPPSAPHTAAMRPHSPHFLCCPRRARHPHSQLNVKEASAASNATPDARRRSLICSADGALAAAQTPTDADSTLFDRPPAGGSQVCRRLRTGTPLGKAGRIKEAALGSGPRTLPPAPPGHALESRPRTTASSPYVASCAGAPRRAAFARVRARSRQIPRRRSHARSGRGKEEGGRG